MFAIARVATGRSSPGMQGVLAARAFSALPTHDCRLSIGVGGYGGIGRELIDQVGAFVKNSKSSAIHLRGIADIDGMCVNPTGMTIEKSANEFAMGELDSKTPMTQASLDGFAEAVVKDTN